MNYLAHLALSADDPLSRIGNWLGDFVKGPLGDSAERFPPRVVDGIRHHRAMDRFTDGHPTFRAAKREFAPESRRVAGIVVDLAFDHFLAAGWETLESQPLGAFRRQVYGEFSSHIEIFPPRARRVAEAIIREDVLGRYASVDGLHLTIERVARRFRRPELLLRAGDEVEHLYSRLRGHFGPFYAAARTESSRLLTA